MTAAPPRRVRILVFEDAEVLDVMGPFEAFSRATRDDGTDAFEARLIARDRQVALRGGLRVLADAPLDASPSGGLFVVPGGPGVRPLRNDRALHAWIAREAASAELVLSVCTGAWLLACAGLLDGLEATTHHVGFDELARLAPTCRVRRGARFVDAGRVLTSAGVSAGVDLALHVIARLEGQAAAARVRSLMEWTS
jgi:transcriptional regulator GlxA family with amidase domain